MICCLALKRLLPLDNDDTAPIKTWHNALRLFTSRRALINQHKHRVLAMVRSVPPFPSETKFGGYEASHVQLSSNYSLPQAHGNYNGLSKWRWQYAIYKQYT
jgi:hypothetical protein